MSQVAVVFSDDPENAKIELTLSGNVIAPADISPQAARLVGKAGENIQAVVHITPPKNNIFDITDAKAEDGKFIAFQLEKKEDKGAQTFILHVSNKKPDPGRYFDKIILKTTSPISPELNVRVFGIIRETSDG